MITIRAYTNLTIRIGSVGEYDVRRIEFDLTHLENGLGDGTATIIRRRADDALAYPAPLVKEGNFWYWYIKREDTSNKGSGTAEVIYTPYDGGVAKSEFYSFFVSDSICDCDTEPPTPEKSWVATVLEAGAAAQEAKKTSETAAETAVESSSKAVLSAEDAKKSKQDAEAAAEDASSAKQDAASAANDARAAKQAAETSATEAMNSASVAEAAASSANASKLASASSASTAADHAAKSEIAANDARASKLTAQAASNDAITSAENADRSAVAASNSAASADIISPIISPLSSKNT